MYIIDYSYIRVYDVYLRRKDPARFATCLYIGLIIGLFLSPIPIFCAELFRADTGNIDAIILLLFAISIFVWTFGTYNKDRIQVLRTKLLNNSDNCSVPTWCLFMIISIGFIWVVLMYWLMLHYVIHPYQLEGIFVK